MVTKAALTQINDETDEHNMGSFSDAGVFMVLVEDKGKRMKGTPKLRPLIDDYPSFY